MRFHVFLYSLPYLAWGCKNCTSSVELGENVEQTMPVTCHMSLCRSHVTGATASRSMWLSSRRGFGRFSWAKETLQGDGRVAGLRKAPPHHFAS
ncbi:uncharacterized protein LACBIDRAFT_296139 [Laccaria bicolor S238N-H82]|uniref:Predicted protein n=1 Tax=Laccaria bicolor (strain S238N-H82 / ATCC MYA-4686) TaxID=486041 RepID=B0E2W8_LACBS|nr:uncharacterized protein LACBIDRAFT_296139 [Laccaria bicolor S238N-H82]EDQ98809.1 predicted protein [Laccaria bicolor S238N-H82]|eukprot:XP_001890539.1 predicted protein [Laccaria bicolor S238N-H82]